MRWPIFSFSHSWRYVSDSVYYVVIIVIFHPRSSTNAPRQYEMGVSFTFVLLLLASSLSNRKTRRDLSMICISKYSRLILSIDIWSSLQCHWRTKFDFRFTESPNHWKGKGGRGSRKRESVTDSALVYSKEERPVVLFAKEVQRLVYHLASSNENKDTSIRRKCFPFTLTLSLLIHEKEACDCIFVSSQSSLCVCCFEIGEELIEGFFFR